MLTIYGQSIARLPISHLLTSSQINNLALRLQSELFIPGDNILAEGTFGNRLCTMRKGLAATFWTKAVASVAVLMEGALFGEVAFFLENQRRLATVRATTSCEVLYVSKHDWQELWTTTDDSSDSHMQKHALHSILEWVKGRLQRYQQHCLRSARKTKRILARRRAPTASNTTTTSSKSVAKSKPKTRLSIKSMSQGIATSVPFQLPKGGSSQLFVSPEEQLLETKARYLLAKTDACANKFHPVIAALRIRRASFSVGSSLTTHRSSISRTKDAANLNDLHRSFQEGALTHDGSKSVDIFIRQFIIDLNPVSKDMRDSLTDTQVQRLESECWTRYKLLAAVQHVVGTLLEELRAPVTGLAAQRPLVKAPSRKGKSKKLRAFRVDRVASRKLSVEVLDIKTPSSISRKSSNGGETATRKPGSSMSGVKVAAARRRIPGAQGGRQQRSVSTMPITTSETEPERLHMTRCRSLPLFGAEFFDKARNEAGHNLTVEDGHLSTGISFELLQRCQRPQYASQLHWHHRYRQWKECSQAAAVVPAKQGPDMSAVDLAVSNKRTIHGISRRFLTLRHIGGHRSAAVGPQLRLPSKRTLHAATTGLDAKAFIRRIQELAKAWDLVMLVVAVYHLVVTPFKVCFPHDLIELSTGVQHGWAALEIFLDVLCLLDLAYKIRYASLTHHNAGTTSVGSHKGGFRHVLTSNPALRADILAMLPLELLLFAAQVRS
ncbi:hypothetical protein BBJ28_00026672, partial [Nothophytophthora sp. Chile5]